MKNNRRSRIIRGSIGTIISLALLYILLSYLKIETLYALVRETRFDMLAFATLIYLSAYIFRAQRFRLIFSQFKPQLTPLVAVVSLHSFLNHILPFRTGEFSFLYFQNRYMKAPYSMASASLIFVRIFDVIALFVWALLLFPPILEVMGRPVQGLLALRLIVVFGVVLCYWGGRNAKIWISVENYFTELSSKANNDSRLHRRIFLFCSKTVGHFAVLMREVPFGRAFLVSILLWLLNFYYFYFILHAFGQKVRFLEAVLPAYGATLGHLLPINGVGSLGTFESGMVLGQIGQGAESATSISLAFLAHAHLLLTGMVAALFAWIYLKLLKN